MKFEFLVSLLCITAVELAMGQQDSGIPASETSRFEENYNDKTSSDWKTYKDKATGRDISFNPKKSELWLNPVTKRYEPVARESGSPDPKENYVKRLSDAPVQKTEKKFNPVTKKFEDVVVEASPESTPTTSAIQYPKSLDNGLPAKTADNWMEIDGPDTSSEWRSYKNKITGQKVSFNPQTSELWFNPVSSKWEPVARETSEKEAYIKGVARQLLYKNKPVDAHSWRCFAYGTVHRSPDECADPDKGGVWLK